MPSQNSPPLAVYAEPPIRLPEQTASMPFATCELLCNAFSRATGSTLQFSAGDPQASSHRAASFSSRAALFPANSGNGSVRPLWSAPVRSSTASIAGHLQLIEHGETNNPAQLDAVFELAHLLGELLNGLIEARTTAETLACEIATTQAMPSKHATADLGHRLQSVLQAMVETLDCTAAGMYVLDDATSLLQLRTMWGLAVDSLTAEPRVLETAKADLEAMLGHAVVLSNKQMFDLWQVPAMEYEAAVCVPLSTATTVLGTVWVYHTQSRTFEHAELNLIEVLTGRLAMELECANPGWCAVGAPPELPVH